ncbi:MAG: hypothetical protein ACKO34_08160 [Vampirovibrionales bacterium]
MMTLALFAEGVSDVGVFAHFIERHTNLPTPLLYFSLGSEKHMDQGKHLYYKQTTYNTETKILREFKSVKTTFMRILSDQSIKTLVFLIDKDRLSDSDLQKRIDKLQALLDEINQSEQIENSVNLGKKFTYKLNENVHVFWVRHQLEDFLMPISKDFPAGECIDSFLECLQKTDGLPTYVLSESKALKRKWWLSVIATQQDTHEWYQNAELMNALIDFNAPVWKELSTFLESTL